MRALKAVRQHYDSYHLKSGVFHFYRGEHGPAAEYLTRVLTEDADVSAAERRAAHYYLVQTLIGAATQFEEIEELDRAIEQYERALAVMPSYPDVQYRLGMALRNRGRVADAVDHFSKALDSNPLYVEALVELGFTQLDLERTEEAQRSMRDAVNARDKKLRLKIDGAEAAMAAGRERTARQMYRDAFQTDLTSFQARFKLGLEHLRAEKWDDAAEELAAAAELCPRFADVHNYVGVALAESGDHEAGIAAFRRSVDINEGYAVAWLNLAFTAHAVDDEALIEKALDAVLAREPDNGPAIYLAEQLRAKKVAVARRSRTSQEDA